eukprot:232539_1
MKTKVNDIVPKFDIAKQIQKLRRMYFDQGGKDHNTKFNIIEIFNDSISNFQQILIRWEFYLYQWRNVITALRDEYPLLGYFTVQDMRFICQEFTQYHRIRQNKLARSSKIPKLTAKFAFIDRNITDTNTEKIIEEWESLEDKIYATELKKLLRTKFKKGLNYSNLKKLIKFVNLYLETEEFSHWFNTEYLPSAGKITHSLISSNLSFSEIEKKQINNDFKQELNEFKQEIIDLMGGNEQNANELLFEMIPFDERKIFGLLGEYLTHAFPKQFKHFHSSIRNMTAYTSIHPAITPTLQKTGQISLTNDISETDVSDEQKHNSNNIKVGWIRSGITLYHTDSNDLVLSRVIKLFSFVNQQPHASQILICSQETTFEDLNCFLHRCCYHDIDGLLYCLVQPENLKSNVTDEILKILFQQLRHSSGAFFT